MLLRNASFKILALTFTHLQDFLTLHTCSKFVEETDEVRVFTFYPLKMLYLSAKFAELFRHSEHCNTARRKRIGALSLKSG